MMEASAVMAPQEEPPVVIHLVKDHKPQKHLVFELLKFWQPFTGCV